MKRAMAARHGHHLRSNGLIRQAAAASSLAPSRASAFPDSTMTRTSASSENLVSSPEDKATEVLELVDALEQDDVQRVFHNRG